MFTKKAGLILISFICLSSVFAQGSLQSPQEFLPTQWGKHFTPHHLLVDYYQHVADNSKQVVVKEYGKSYQKRPLLYAIASSPKNLARIEEIRTNNLKRTGLMDGTVNEKEQLAIVWLSFGVHGNEAGAPESAIQVIYELANSDNKQVQDWLKNTVVIIDPCLNPDGFSRYAHWSWNVGNQIVNPSPLAREHDEPWPGGRVNHYLFDLNRDWAWQTQVETQQRLDAYQNWMPHLHVDFHEMFYNDHYYFAPAAQPFHQYITNWQAEFQTQVGLNHTKYFDREGWLYFTREIFDLFYPSYGDTYPTFNGAIGMTYEQGGHSRAGRAIVRESGDTLTLQDRIDHHTATALSTVEVSAKNAPQLVNSFAKYFSDAINEPPGDYRTFVVKADNDADKLEKLCQFLDKHQIRYGRSQNQSSIKAFDYRTGKTGMTQISAADLIVSAYQPKAVLTQVLFEPEPLLPDSLTYDITAWALPYAYDLEAYASTQRIGVNAKYERPQVETVKPEKTRAYGYVVEWSSLKDARFLKDLLDQKIAVRAATEAFEIAGRKFGIGTLVINRGDNRKHRGAFERMLFAAAQTHQQELIPLTTGFATKGADLGSARMRLLEKPDILVLSGEETSTNDFGHVWYFFEQDLGQAITIIDAEDLGRTDLDDFNTLVLPSGSYRSIDDGMRTKIKRWVRGGGKLIAIGGALSKFEDKDGFTLSKYATSSEKEKARKAREEARLNSRLQTFEGQERKSIVNAMPGAIYKLRMDNTHPLGYGFSEHYFSLKTTRRNYNFLKNTWNVGYIEKDAMYIGFVGANAQKGA
ncbi:MAG: M14 family metallopeptidase, partial [Bacteroidota bacterium]